MMGPENRRLTGIIGLPQPSLPLWIPVASGLAWAAMAFFLVKRWATSRNWEDRHRRALVSSVIVVGMAASFLGSSTWSRADLSAKIVCNVVAVVLLLALRGRIFRGQPESL